MPLDINVENKCPQCGRELASKESVARHLEKYCRYRQGKKAKQPVVARQRVAVDIDDDGDLGVMNVWLSVRT